MTGITGKLHSMAQRLEAGKIFSNSEMQDLLLDAADIIGGEEIPPETDDLQFTGFMIGRDGTEAKMAADNYVTISDGADTVMFNRNEVYLLIMALKKLHPMMGEPE